MKRTRLRPESPRRRRERREYDKLRAAYLEGHPVCQLCEEAPASDVHHKRGRGSLLLDVDHWAALCRQCHTWATEHPAEAIRLGVSGLRIGEW